MYVYDRLRLDHPSSHPEGEVLPNVFPLPKQLDPEGTKLHDIFRGSVPLLEDNEVAASGWLRIAMAGPNQAAYLAPDLDEETYKQAYTGSRNSMMAGLAIEDSFAVPRALHRFRSSTLGRPHFEFGRLKVPHEQDPRLETAHAETAVGFTGVIDLDGVRAHAGGVHFPSGNIQGWVYIGEALEE
jgi:hypothetical protein